MPEPSRFWDRHAEGYAKRPVADEAAYQKKLQVTQEYLRPEMEVLEFGCGTGSTALVHAPHVRHIRAIDISAKMLDIARGKAEAAKVGNVTFEQAAIDDFEVVRYGCAPVCQTDLGMGGPGTAQFSICGQSLDSGNLATLLLEQAPPSSPAILFIGLANNPTPFKGGLLVPFPALIDITFVTNGAGELSFPVAGGGGPLTVYAQFAMPDPGQVLGVALSNALEIVVGP